MFTGSYCDFRTWNGALTSGQVASLYAAGPDVVAGPRLKITHSGNQVMLQQPANASGLETTSSHSGPWTAVSGNITVSNDLNNLTMTLGPAACFNKARLAPATPLALGGFERVEESFEALQVRARSGV